MPPARTARPRAMNNENDENAVTRVTRAKAAAQGENDIGLGAAKKAMQVKKSTTTLTAANAQRKRTALGDVSNMKRAESEETGKDAKKIVKPSLTKTSNGITKPGRAPAVQKPLGLKEKPRGAAATEAKRPGSGSGVVGGGVKKRSVGAPLNKNTIKEEEAALEEPPHKRVMLETDATISSELSEKVEGVQDVLVDPKDEIPDLDAEDEDDPLMVAEYAVEIFEYLRELEITNMPNASYMEFQDHLTWKKRDMLNDWLIEVHQKFQLLPETFYLAINIIDRFLSRKIVQLDKLQLVGITAMFIASKYEEVMSPHVSNFSYLAQEYTDEEILSAERFVLETLNYDLSFPNPMNFLRRISKADEYDMQTRTIGKYLLEISCLDHRFLQYPPSQTSAAAMYFARLMLERGEWHPTIAHYAGYTEEELAPVFNLMIDYVTANKPKHEAFHNKYASRKYLKASLLVKAWARRHFGEAASTRQPAAGADNVLGAADIKTR